MDWGRIRSWERWRAVRGWLAHDGILAQWDGWRRYGPTAGSVAAHAVVGLAIASMIGASVNPRPTPVVRPVPQLEVTLVAETPMAALRPDMRRSEPTTQPRAPDVEAIPVKPRATAPRKDDKRSPTASADAADAEAVYLPPSILSDDGTPLGLRGMLESDRCNPKTGLKPADCGAQWSAKIEQTAAWQLASKDELKQHYRAFMPLCPYKVGCEPSDGVLLNGARSFGLKSPMASGAGGLQGIHETVGRLGFNPDHTDPGFGD